MKRLIVVSTLLSSILLANCTQEQEQKAIKIWKETIFEKDNQKKIDMLQKANGYCELPQIAVDGNIAYYYTLSKKELKNRTTELEKLEIENSKLSGVDNNHIKNNQRKIDILFGRELTEGLRAVTEIGGEYRANILFKKNSDKIEASNRSHIEEIIEQFNEVVKENSNAIFTLEGGASSEGEASYNQRLSQKRADALKKYIVLEDRDLKKHIEIESKGEQNLVCEGDFLPEVNPNTGEAECITQEDRDASRRVTIRRKI